MHRLAGSAIQPGGLYRIRATGQPMHLPVGLHATRSGMQITFTEPLDEEAARELLNYQVTTWSLKRTENYGSDHYGTKHVAVESVQVSADRKTITLLMPDIQPTWCMEINYSLKLADGAPFLGVIHNTVHQLSE